jgi:hypothetical protein
MKEVCIAIRTTGNTMIKITELKGNLVNVSTG